MSNSSQPKDYLTTYISSDSSIDNTTFTITSTPIDSINIGTITLNDTITLTGSGSTYTIGGSDTDYTFNWGASEEWVDSFPDWQRVQDMCKQYPGLEIALRNFRTIYTLVKDDYDNPKDEK